MNSAYTFSIYESVKQLPSQWNSLATSNIFLSTHYLDVLEESAPQNMSCFFIGIFENKNLVGIALSQFLDLNKLESFGERDKCVKTFIRNIIFRNFCSHVLLMGNNMLTGQNAFQFSPEIDSSKGVETLYQATNEIKKTLKQKGLKVHLTTLKDFDTENVSHFSAPDFQTFYRFTTQPNMVFCSCDHWATFDDYIAALAKKYRDQYKRCRKKAEGIQKKKMDLEEIIAQEETIYDLYHHVAQNAPFNTFFLAKNHFRVMKEKLKDNFLFYGYFENGSLIGFNTLIKNGNQMDTYFLGYDEKIQREKMLYLNMLYDMIAYSINQGFKEIVFARTALEIKSSVGAKPVEMFGFMQHSNVLINKKMEQLFCYLEPKTDWQERNPFK
ncbi:GNAT family N-acetyltransferase [Flavobacterium sp.]|uniref:peptidogalycan biosysnthesis protein n=1 Tax=Flavobacterium sp. TaxID=239 RepID=UPI0025B83F7A|nr:GNAT family N-acetyltransferase [Flavobacterium sp.]MBA4154120.1 8-amino-7-oxononanoate synthase [Flavobacterium sp.]